MARRSSAAGGRCTDTDDETRTPSGRPRRPQLVVAVDVNALAGDPAGIVELDDGTPVPQSILQRWACDCSIGRVVMAGGSVPVDLGRITYTPSPGQRRALTARDRRCIVPGCKRKARWCEAHHVVPFPDGPTNLSNLVLLCRRHHKHVHTGIIKLVRDETSGTSEAAEPGCGWIPTRADGTLLLQRPPPRLVA
jgi:hypothetical protein